MRGKVQTKVSAHVPKSRSYGGDFFKTKVGRLDLGDSTTFWGKTLVSQAAPTYGEVVFNTGMTGYVETLTDPSYAGQILIFTYPLIGNYGVQLPDVESTKIHLKGVVMSELAAYGSHLDADSSLFTWLQAQHIPFLAGVDTRALTKHLRVHGTMPGVLSTSDSYIKNDAFEQNFVSISEPETFGKGAKKVILVDCGAKENILRSLLNFPLTVKRVPYDYDYTDEAYDGVVLSNGPGDPEAYEATIAIVRKALGLGKPVFGICLGSQLMALAAGARTYRLKYGHRGHNQPAQDERSKRSYITSQNHGYAIDEHSLPTGWQVSFRNLNDGSVEGIRHTKRPFFSVQFHPEASPGPTDTAWLFKQFYDSL